MTCTVEGVYAKVRSRVADDITPGGQIFRDNVLVPYFNLAYQRMMGRMAACGVPQVVKTVYHTLPARTSYLSVGQLGVNDFSAPEKLWERGGVTKATITATSAATPVVITAAAHGFADGAEVFISLVGPEINGRWFITWLSADTFSLNGSSSAVAYSSGLATTSSEIFGDPMTARDNLSQREPQEALAEYFWDGAFRFVGSTGERQLKIRYASSGATPTSGDIGIDGCENYLVVATADLAYRARGSDSELMATLKTEAEQFLAEFLQAQVRQMQRLCYQPPRRHRRPRTHLLL